MIYIIYIHIYIYNINIYNDGKVGSGLGSEDVGGGLEINVSGSFSESYLDTFDCKLDFEAKFLIVLDMFKANLAFPGSTRYI